MWVVERVADFLVAATFGLSSSFGVEDGDGNGVGALFEAPVNKVILLLSEQVAEGRDRLSVRLHDWAAGQTRKYIQALLSA